MCTLSLLTRGPSCTQITALSWQSGDTNGSVSDPSDRVLALNERRHLISRPAGQSAGLTPARFTHQNTFSQTRQKICDISCERDMNKSRSFLHNSTSVCPLFLATSLRSHDKLKTQKKQQHFLLKFKSNIFLSCSSSFVHHRLLRGNIWLLSC